MQLRQLGKSGLSVPLIGLGCNNFGMRMDQAATTKVVNRALDVGITFFDTSDSYSRGASETQLGVALGAKRKDALVASKFASPMDDAGKLKGASRSYIMFAVEQSLKRLGTDYIDLYQYHKPDPLTPMEETLRALDDLVRQGKVRYIGCSNLPAWGVVESQWLSRELGAHRFISCQDEYNLLVRERVETGLSAVMQSYGVGLLPFFPLASALLTGKYKRNAPKPEGSRLTNPSGFLAKYITDANLDKVEKLEAFAKARGHTLVELAFSWLAAQPFVSCIIAGATKIEQIDQNAEAANWKLTKEDLAEIDKIAPPPPQK